MSKPTIKTEEGGPRYGIADVSAAGRKVWLVKVPERMAELFSSAAPGADLAQLVVTRGPEGNKIQVKVPTSKGTSNYTLKPAPLPVPFLGFAETAEERLIRFTGTVQSKFDMVPESDDATYRASLQEAQKKRTTKKSVQVGYDDDGIIEPTVFRNDTVKRSTIDEDRKVADKRERLDKDIVRDRILAKFREAKFVTFKDMNEYCQQPDAWLKSILNELAIYNSSGKEKGYWHLKPDFATFQAKTLGIDPARYGSAFTKKDPSLGDDEDRADAADAMDVDQGGGGGGDGGDYDMVD